MEKKIFLYASICASLLFLVSCKNDEKEKDSVTSPSSQLQTLKPTGTISGKIVDRHTEKPVSGAVVSIAFNGSVVNSTTDESGSFSFASVPCNKDATSGTVTGTYQLTVSLVGVNASIPDSLPKYREYYFNTTLTVTFIYLAKNDSTKNIPTEGLEANIRFDVGKMNTTINGSVVDENYGTVANAKVYLEEFGTGDVLQTTTTDASGNYVFQKVEGGTSVNIEARSVDGTLQGQLNGSLLLIINKNSVNLRSQVNAERIVLSSSDNIAPYVIKITPENLSDVVNPNGLKIVYQFSEPIKQTSYTVTNVPLGLGTIINDINFNFLGFKKATGNANVSLSWDSTYTVLTVTPTEVVGSAKYSINISAALAKLTDRAGNAVVPKAIVGDFEVLSFTTNGGSIIPSVLSVTRRLNIGLGFSPLDFTGGNVGLEWNVDVNARNYRIYRSMNNEPYVLLADNINDIRYTDNTGVLVTSYTPPADRDPYKNITVKYRVHGISKDLVEGITSNIITVKDDVAPQVSGVTVDSSAGILQGDYIYLQFSEPLTISLAQTISNYTISGSGLNSIVSEAVYTGFDSFSSRYVVRLTVTKHSIDKNDVLIVSSLVTDLSGNAIDATKNNVKF